MAFAKSNESPSEEIAKQGEENLAVDRGLQPTFSPDIGRLKLEGNIILGNVILNRMDSYGNAWVIRDIDGWWTPPGSDVPTVSRGFGDGDYEVQGRFRSRSFSIRGSILPPNPSNVENARDTLTAVVAGLPRQGVWFKTGNDPIRASYVVLDGEVDIDVKNPQGRIDYEIPLRAVDPIKYAWNDASPDGYELFEIPAKNSENQIDGTGVVENIGNYPVPVFFEISGPFAGPGTIFNKSTEELIILTQSLKGPISRSIVNKQLTFDVSLLKDVATLTTTEPHDFSVGDSVFVSGIGSPFDGDQLITATPTDTTFSFDADSSEITPVAFKSLESAVAELRTTEPHGLSAGQQIVVAGVDSLFDGTYTIASTPTASSLTYTRTRVPPRTIVSASLISNIATINVSDTHQFIVGETVVVTGAGPNYNGTHEITAVPSATSFSYASTRTNARDVIRKQMIADVVYLTTATPHGFVAGENVNVSGIDFSLNGGYTIAGITTNTGFVYARPRATEKRVITKARSNNVATLTTAQPHGFVVGEKVFVTGVGSGAGGDYNGYHTITSLPSATTFTFANTGSNQVSTTVTTSGRARAGSRKISSILLAGNVVTVTTRETHGAILDENITITGVGPELDGNYTVSAIPFLNVLEFQKTGDNIPIINYPVDEETGASADVFVELSGDIDATDLSPAGTAEVGGSLPLSATGGSASVSDEIAETQTGGNIIKTNNVQFTPGLTGASAVVQADILEIDTKNREVAFNGEIEGARGRVDVLADFIQLGPGQNELEFVDTGNPDSTATLRVFYRSGWLS